MFIAIKTIHDHVGVSLDKSIKLKSPGFPNFPGIFLLIFAVISNDKEIN